MEEIMLDILMPHEFLTENKPRKHSGQIPS